MLPRLESRYLTGDLRSNLELLSLDKYLSHYLRQFSILPMHVLDVLVPVLSKVDDFATFKKVEVHAKNSTF